MATALRIRCQILDARWFDEYQPVEEIGPFRRRADGERRAERRGDHLHRMVHPADDLPHEILDQGDVEIGGIGDARAVGEAKAEQVERIDAVMFGKLREDAPILERRRPCVYPVDQHQRLAAPAHGVADAATSPGVAPMFAFQHAIRLARRCLGHPIGQRQRADAARRRQRRDLPDRWPPTPPYPLNVLHAASPPVM